jgi:PhoPQ-activated pathogenicity-related protein
MICRPRLSLTLTTLLLLIAASSSLVAEDSLPARTALDDYIGKPDASFTWKIVKDETARGMRTVVIDFVSQTWRTAEDVDRPEWRHWLSVAIPVKRKSDIGLVMIAGGSNGGNPPDGPSEITTMLAQSTGSLAAELKMIPNQAIEFHQDGVPRKEDDLIGYTWDQYLKTGDPTWPARNPMVKSAVRAMDILAELTAKDKDAPAVDKFVIAGASKRGWTTWLTGAMDDRVVAIIPIVIDVLNLQPSIRNHFAAYGFWAPAVGNYVEHRITERMDHPRMHSLCELVDPFCYRHRLTMPKFIVNAAGDQFFPPDSSNLYFDKLQGTKHLRYVPNADHGLDGTDAVESLVSYYSMIVTGKKPPEFTWKLSDDGVLHVTSEQKPTEVLLWQATNPVARDFRLETLGPMYKSQVLKSDDGLTFQASLVAPEKGWTASFAELTFDVGGLFPIKFTTNVYITPDVMPFKDKDSQKPATITIMCNAPNAEVAAKIKQASRSSLIDAVTDEMRYSAGEAKASGSIPVRLNWRTKGTFRNDVESVRDWLRDQGCDGFQYQLESGPVGGTAN